MSKKCLDSYIFAMVINHSFVKKESYQTWYSFFLHKKKRHLVALFRLGIRTLV